MRALVAGRHVAIIGRAGSIIGTGNGPAIDRADVVIRINWVLPLDASQAGDIGTRTDLVYHCKRARTARRASKRHGIPHYRVIGKYRTRIAKRYFKRPNDFRPTTGFMAIIECLESGAARIDLFGFDFFTSGHVQERMPEKDNYAKPLGWAHSPEEERRAMKRLLKSAPNIFPDAVLKAALQ